MNEEVTRWLNPDFDEEDVVSFKVDFLPNPIPLEVTIDFDLNRFKPEKATSHKEIMKELFQEIVV